MEPGKFVFGLKRRIKNGIKKKLQSYIPIVGLKLALISGLSIGVNLLILIVIDYLIQVVVNKVKAKDNVELHIISPILIGLLPVIFFVIFFSIYRVKLYFTKRRGKKTVKRLDVLGILASMKYNRYFPYWYSYSKPKQNKTINFDQIGLQDCDIVLKRSKDYLDGLIFSQNTYFTHVGIYYKRDDAVIENGNTGDDTGCESRHRVLHATIAKGVNDSSLENFVMDDEMAVFRFSLERTKEEFEIYKCINDEDSVAEETSHIRELEDELFNTLLHKTKLDYSPSANAGFGKQYREVILERAKSLRGRGYDTDFNFNDFKRFSCIEYVWYCFKSLFPFHRIRVKDFEFFRWIVMPVIVPDVFIKNDFFHFVWTNISLKTDVFGKKEKLKRMVKRRKSPLGPFLRSILIWDIIILLIHYWLCRT